MKLPNINDSAWGWKDNNGLCADGVMPLWEITIRWGWIEIDFYPTKRSTLTGSITLPAPEDSELARQLAEQSALWLEEKLFNTGYYPKNI